MNTHNASGRRIALTFAKWTAIILVCAVDPAVLLVIVVPSMIQAETRTWEFLPRVQRWSAALAASSVIVFATIIKTGNLSVVTALAPGLIDQWAAFILVSIPFALFAVCARLCIIAENQGDQNFDLRYIPGIRAAMREGALSESRRRAKNLPLTTRKGPVLGAVVRQDHRHAIARIRRKDPTRLKDWVRRGMVALPHDLNPPHFLIFGQTGCGKTETAFRLGQSWAAFDGTRPIYIDGKGSQADQARFNEVFSSMGYRVGNFPDQPMDIWRGSAREVQDRLISCMSWSEPFYKDQAKAALGLIILHSPFGPPRTAAEFRARLADPRTAISPDRQRELADLTQGRHATWAGTASRYSAWLDDIEEFAPGGPGSFGWEDFDAVYVRLSMATVNESMVTLAGALIRDFEAATILGCQRRGSDNRPIMLFADEFAAYAKAAPNMVSLMQRARSQNIKVALMCQDWTGLGPDADALIDAGVTFILGAGDNPEPVLNRAGSKDQIEVAHASGSGTMSARLQQAFLVDAQESRQSRPGEVFLINRGQFVKCVVSLAITNNRPPCRGRAMPLPAKSFVLPTQLPRPMPPCPGNPVEALGQARTASTSSLPF